MERGDVLEVELPPPPGGTGREQAGRRPAIVVQSDPTDRSIPTLAIVPLTGSLAALRFPCTVRIEPSAENGLTRPSVMLVFQVRAIDRSRIGQTIGRLEPDYLDLLEAELRSLLALG